MAGTFDNSRKLFISDGYKLCKMCSRPMNKDDIKDTCPSCEENMLFREVREYIRNHDVTEYQLAEKFNISQDKVRTWIKEGRIEYVHVGEDKIVGSRCQRCGAAVGFGSLCPSCLRLMNGEKRRKGVAVFNPANRDNGKMRFLGKDE